MFETKKEIRWSKIKVGLVVTIALLVLLGAVFFAGNIQNLFSKEVDLRIQFPSVEGLRRGAPVWVLGLEEGTVGDMRLDPLYGVVVDISIHKNAMRYLKKDSEATILTMGLLGDKYIELGTGSPEAEPLLPGEMIKGTPQRGMRDVMETSAKTIAKMTEVLDKLGGFISNIEQGKGTVAKLISDPAIYENLKESTRKTSLLIADLKSFIENMKNSRGTVRMLIEDPTLYNRVLAMVSELEEFSKTVNGGSGTFKKLLEDPSLYNKMLATASELEEFSKVVNKSPGTFKKLLEDPSLYDKMLATVSDLEELSRKVKEGKGTLGRLLESPELYDDLDKNLKQLSSILGKIEKGEGLAGALVTDSELTKELERTIEEMKNLLKDIKEHPKKYFKFSLF